MEMLGPNGVPAIYKSAIWVNLEHKYNFLKLHM